MGSLVNAATSVILLLLVTRFLGDEKAGVFSFGFSVSLMMLTVGMFKVRPLLTKLTAMWNENRRKAFLLTVVKLVL